MKRLFPFLILCLALLNGHFSSAQTPTWKNITPAGWSGKFQTVDWFDGNGLLAIADNGYFYKSVDTGKTWQSYPKPVNSVSSITLYPDHKRAFICGGNHLYKTIDAAKTWQEIKYTGMPSNISIFTIYIKTEDTLLASTSNGENGAKVYLSPDTGKTWKLVGTNLEGDNPLGSDISVFYFVNSAHGYGLGDGFYVETVNGGITWSLNIIDLNTYFYGILEIQGHPSIISTNTSNPPPTSNSTYYKGFIRKFVQAGTMIYGVYGGDFYSSADNGITWKITSVNSYKNFQSLTFLDQQTGVIVGNDLTTYRTTDGGTTWTKSIYGGGEGYNKLYCKTKYECYITGNAGRLFHTIDGGTSWNYNDLYSSKLEEIKFPTPDTGYVSANSAIFRTIDGGQTWTSFTHSTQGNFIDFTLKDIGYIGFTYDNYIYKTTDGGVTWNDIWTQSGGGAIAFRSGNEGLMSGSNNLLYTKDGADTWTKKANGIFANFIIPLKENWIVLNTSNVYLCDKNINCTLKYTDTSNSLWGIVRRDSNTYIASAGNDSIILSTDKGNTWIKEYFPSPGQITFGDKNTLYSLNPKNIYRAIFKAKTTSSQFTIANNTTLSCSITNDANENYCASILAITGLHDTIMISKNTAITNGVSFTIQIPNTIQEGTSYKIIIAPIDTMAYSMVESQTFTKTETAVNEIESMPIIKVIGRRILCDCNDFKIYNSLGQLMKNNDDLPIGIYIVKCKNETQKIIIKP